MSDFRRNPPPDGSLQRWLCRLLRDHCSMTAPYAAERVGSTRQTTGQALRQLAARGFIEAVRRPGNRLFYRALKTTLPRDRRGKSPGSLRTGASVYARWVVMMTRKHGSTWRPKVRPVLELERAWPSANTDNRIMGA